MASVKELLAEFRHEVANTKRVLDRVPEGKNEWTPHEKSMSVGALANHVAELHGWVEIVVARDELDFAKGEYVPNRSSNAAERSTFFEEQVALAESILAKASDEDLEQTWTLKWGDKILFQAPKKVALRSTVFSHIIHHRAQLGVYLRLLGIPVPGIYGPTADEQIM